ncbi:MAG: PD40 domain-containing protein [Armatimonadota bacterium]|nr:MAG: PD40 domain-containing protein [Armatimonadota bacterium]
MSGKSLVGIWAAIAGVCLAMILLATEARPAGISPKAAFLNSEFGVSPDGGVIAYPLLAYDTYGDPVSEVWVASVDGSGKRRVGSLPGAWDVRWYDSAHLAATRFDSNKIHVISLNGGAPSILSLTYSFFWARPALSPDNTWVAFAAVTKEPRESGVFALDVRTGEVNTLTKDVVKSFVDWSPDSKRIVYGAGDYQQHYRLTIVDVASGTVTDTGCDGVGARWSPDGKWIAYTGNVVRGGGWWNGVPMDGSILKTNVETKQTVVLTEPPVNTRDEKTGRRELSGAIHPVWSPDGKKITCRRLHQVVGKEDREASEDELWVMDSDGSNRRRVLEQFCPYAWAWDSQSLFVKDETGIAQIALESGTRRQVVTWTLPEPPEVKEEDWQTSTSPGARVRYARIAPEYAKAILALAETARRIYADTLRADMPAVVGVTVTKDASAQTSLWTDGESEMFLTITSMDKLAPPQQSGIFNIYGICHELGHIAMYRRIRTIGLPNGVGEGWAHYAGSVVTDEVYKQRGQGLWPVPYDYRADGVPRLQRQLSDPEALRNPTTRAAAAFYQAHQRYRGETVFAAMNEATVGKPYGKDVMPRFVNALVKLTGDESARALFPNDIVEPSMEWHTAHREINDQAVAGAVNIPDATGMTLKYDDGESDGKRSTAGAGHAVVFKRPAGNWAVDAVEMYGSRYGETEPPKDNFSIFICDQDFNVIKEIQQPYSKLTYGDEPQWDRFEFEPVQVPEGFYVCVFFEPTYTKGFYVHYDEGEGKTHSRSALPWSFVRDVEYDWMIRVHLRKLGG